MINLKYIKCHAFQSTMILYLLWKYMYTSLCLCEPHLHFVAVEEVNVWFVLFVVLTDEQKDGRVSRLVQQRLTVMNCGQRKVFKLFLRERKRNKDQEN